MADEDFGDVINLDSSDDELSSSRKRPLGSLSENGISDMSSRSSKRARKGVPRGGSQNSAQRSSSEEGEINEDDFQAGERQNGNADPKSDVPSQGSQGNPEGSVKGTPRKNTPAAYVPVDGPLFASDTTAFKLPVFSGKREGAWDDRFRAWATIFYTHNVGNASSIDASLVHAAFVHYIDVFSGLKIKKRKAAKHAATDLRDSGALGETLQSAASLPAATETSEPPKPLQESSTHDTVPAPRPDPAATTPTNGGQSPKRSEEHDLSLQKRSPKRNGGLESHRPVVSKVTTILAHGNRLLSASADQLKYFPSASEPSNMCLSCGGEGHIAATCPGSVCKFCDSTDHWHYNCPTKARCSQCRQHGHIKQACREKLALTKDEGLTCGFCGQGNHVEKECNEVWRSFHPHAQSNVSVISLPVSCSNCGDSNHYVGDCSDCAHYGPTNQTWTLANHNLYVDPESNSAPIAYTDVGARVSGQPARAPGMRIRGHAARTGNIVHYSDSDSEEPEFLGKRAVKKAGIQPIRMSSNIMMPADRSRANGTAGLPPLPPGPPPRQPPNGFSRLKGAAGGPGILPPPPSLPAKPPPGDFRNAPPPRSFDGGGGDGGGASSGNRGSGQRGGRGGRGRGRGRGKSRGRARDS